MEQYLQEELEKTRTQLKNTPFESDYPEIDDSYRYKLHEDYIDENIDDFILRVEDKVNYHEEKDTDTLQPIDKHKSKLDNVPTHETRQKQIDTLQKKNKSPNFLIKIAEAVYNIFKDLMNFDPSTQTLTEIFTDTSHRIIITSIFSVLFLIIMLLIQL